MTGNIRILLAQIATFEAQHKAGLNPPVTALAEFFDTARLAKLDVDTLDRGMALPDARHATTSGTPLERYDEQLVEFVARLPLSLLTRVVLSRLEPPAASRAFIGVDLASGPDRAARVVIGRGPCGA